MATVQSVEGWIEGWGSRINLGPVGERVGAGPGWRRESEVFHVARQPRESNRAPGP